MCMHAHTCTHNSNLKELSKGTVSEMFRQEIYSVVNSICHRSQTCWGLKVFSVASLKVVELYYKGTLFHLTALSSHFTLIHLTCNVWYAMNSMFI